MPSKQGEGAFLLPAFARKSQPFEALSFADRSAGTSFLGSSSFEQELSRRVQSRQEQPSKRTESSDTHIKQKDKHEAQNTKDSKQAEETTNNQISEKRQKKERKAKTEKTDEKDPKEVTKKKDQAKENLEELLLSVGILSQGVGKKKLDESEKLSSAKIIETLLQKPDANKGVEKNKSNESKEESKAPEFVEKPSLFQSQNEKDAVTKQIEKPEPKDKERIISEKSHLKHIVQEDSKTSEGILRENTNSARWVIEDHRTEKQKSDISVSKLEKEVLEEALRGVSQKQSKNKSSNDAKSGNEGKGGTQAGVQGMVHEGTLPKENAFDLSFNRHSGELQKKNQAALERLVERARINIQRNGDSQASIRLNPRLLGSLTLHIRLEQNALQGQVFVENKAAYKLIKQELEFLKQELHRQGIQVESLHLKLREPAQSSFSFQEESKDGANAQAQLEQGRNGQNGHFRQDREGFFAEPHSQALYGHALQEKEYGEATLVLADNNEGIDIRI